MAKDINDIKTLEIQLTLNSTQIAALRQAIELQLKSFGRAERAQRLAGRDAIADTLKLEGDKLLALMIQLSK